VWDGEAPLPECKRGGVYIVRDPRGTYVSAESDGESGEEAVSAAMFLERRMDEHEHNERVSRVSFELLCERPDEILPQIWKALGLEPHDGPMPTRVQLAPWVGRIHAPHHNQIVVGCGTFLARYKYPTDAMPMVGDALKSFMDGKPIAEIEGGEDMLRAEFVAFTNVFERTRQDMVHFGKACGDEIQRLETAPHTSEWERWYVRGEISSLIRCNDAIGHVCNRLLDGMMR
jgi:hypothetical protein